jgi:capsular exopolysaccharide synthesis family protein
MQTSNVMNGAANKTLRDFYDIVFRQKRKALLFFFTVLAVVIVGNIVAPRVYRSEAKFLIKLGRQDVTVDPTVGTGPMLSVSQPREAVVNSELEILLSRELAGKVVDAIGGEAVMKGSDGLKAAKSAPEKPAQPESLEQQKLRDKAARYLLKNLTVEVVKKSNIIALGYEAKSPQMAHDVLAKLLDEYLSKHISVYKAVGSYDFFDGQKKDLFKALADTEQKINELKKTNNISAMQEQQVLLLTRVGQLKTDVETTEAEIAVTDAKVFVLQDVLSRTPDIVMREKVTGGALSAADEMRKTYNSLMMKEKELLSTFTADSVPVKETRNQIAAAQQLLQQTEENLEVREGINENKRLLELDLANSQALLASDKAKLATLKEQLSSAQSDIQRINDTELQLTQLVREKEISDLNYRKYAESLEQTRIDNELETDRISNISVSQAPTNPLYPIRPRVLLNVVLGALLGLFGGLGVAFFFDYLDHTFKKPEDIESKLQFAAFGAVPLLTTIPGQFNPKSPLKRHGDAFADRLLASARSQAKPFKTLSVTACHPGEGATTLATYFAAALADRGTGRVLLVDANLQAPNLHGIFGVTSSPGLYEILSQGKALSSAIQPTSVANLDILPAGKADQPDTRKLFESKNFRDIISQWQHEYDFVVFDMPAVWEESHAAVLGSAVDGVLMVIEAEKVRWQVAQRAKARLEDGGALFVGGILNKRRFYVPAWLYNKL